MNEVFCKLKNKNQTVEWLLSIGARHLIPNREFWKDFSYHVPNINKYETGLESHKLLFYFYSFFTDSMKSMNTQKIIHDYFQTFYDVCELDKNGNSYLHFFAQFQLYGTSSIIYPSINPKSKNYLYNKKIDYNLQNKDGDTWFHIFCKNQSLRMGYISIQELPIDHETMILQNKKGQICMDILKKRINEDEGLNYNEFLNSMSVKNQQVFHDLEKL